MAKLTNKQKEEIAYQRTKEGFIDLMIRGKVLLKTPWFNIWLVRK